jgi:hypothetical protein
MSVASPYSRAHCVLSQPERRPAHIWPNTSTVQHWMGHKSLETTIRYLVSASDVYGRLDRVVVPSVAKDAGPPRKSVRQVAQMTGKRYAVRQDLYSGRCYVFRTRDWHSGSPWRPRKRNRESFCRSSRPSSATHPTHSEHRSATSARGRPTPVFPTPSSGATVA